MKKTIVLGSVNMDLVVSTNRVPEGGETLTGDNFHLIPGGKGANQAVAIKRQEGSVSMIARVGDDVFGNELLDKLSENMVDVKHVKKDKFASSGVALIVVEKNGQNRIIVVAGANGHLNITDVEKAFNLLEECEFLVVQLEIPLDVVNYAVTNARNRNIKTILNASPIPENLLQDDFLRKINYLIVNETEAQVLTNIKVDDKESAINAAKILQRKTSGTVLLTLGAQGAVTAIEDEVWHTKAFTVNAVDTTAAGDAFIGGFITSLQRDNDLKNAVLHGCASGALATCKFGAQPSLPTLSETNEFLSNYSM